MTVLVAVGGVIVALIMLQALVILPARRRGNAAYRQRTDDLIDEAMGTWAPESMIARDRQRGYGRWSRVRGVRE